MYEAKSLSLLRKRAMHILAGGAAAIAVIFVFLKLFIMPRWANREYVDLQRCYGRMLTIAKYLDELGVDCCPRQLDELHGKRFSKEPVSGKNLYFDDSFLRDPYSGKQFIYRRAMMRSNGLDFWVLISVGPDGKLDSSLGQPPQFVHATGYYQGDFVVTSEEFTKFPPAVEGGIKRQGEWALVAGVWHRADTATSRKTTITVAPEENRQKQDAALPGAPR